MIRFEASQELRRDSSQYFCCKPAIIRRSGALATIFCASPNVCQLHNSRFFPLFHSPTISKSMRNEQPFFLAGLMVWSWCLWNNRRKTVPRIKKRRFRSFHTFCRGWKNIYIRRIGIESSRKCLSLHFSPRNDYLVNFSNKTFYGFLSWLVQGWNLIKCKYKLNYDGAGKDGEIGDGVKDKEEIFTCFPGRCWELW